MEFQKHQPGNFCWPELGSTNTDAAKKFYGNLLGWTSMDVPGPGMIYTMFQLSGKDVAGLYALMPEQIKQGFPPAWLCYVSVESADNTAKRVQELGGNVMLEPMDIPEAGRTALFQDPLGATFGVWQAGKHIGARIINEVGAFCWAELATSDEKAARGFYQELFRWDHEIMPTEKFEYIIFKNDGQPAAGMFQITPDMQGLSPSWFVYFAVADCDQSVQKAQGGRRKRDGAAN